MPGPDTSNSVSGKVEFNLGYLAYCGKASRDRNKVQIVCSRRQETLAVGTVKTAKAPKSGDKKAICGFVQDTRNKLQSVIKGLEAYRKKLNSKQGSPAKIKEANQMIGQIKDLLKPPPKNNSKKNSQKEVLDPSSSYAEYKIMNSQQGAFKIPLKFIWNPKLVCK